VSEASWRAIDAPDPGDERGELHWYGLEPDARRQWFERLWQEAALLRARYRLALRSGWWEDGIQVEALAALAAWVARYDSGEWDDPPGKLALLYDLERLALLLRYGGDPFDPVRDRPGFLAYLQRLDRELR
jgi:hypothetical protein